jgi:putative methylase
MLSMVSKKQVAIALSKLKTFDKSKIKLEQYTTDSEIASVVLWDAFMQGVIEEKVVADLGCGTGILGIGALLLGAKKVLFVDVDKDALIILETNLKDLELDNFEIIHTDVSEFNAKVDLVLQNPPFGTKQKHADKKFLEKAFSVSEVVFSFHKSSTKQFVKAISNDFKFNIAKEFEFDFPLKNTMKIHKKKMEKIKVSCFELVSSLS